MSEPVSMRRLREAALDDPQFMGELVEMYLTDAADQLAALEQAIASADLTTTRRTAHRLRGASSNVGAQELARLCSALEELSSEGVAAELSAAESLRGEFERVAVALQDFVVQAKSEGR